MNYCPGKPCTWKKSFVFSKSLHASLFELLPVLIFNRLPLDRECDQMFWLDTARSRECIWIYIQPYSYFPNPPLELRRLIFINSGWGPPRTDQIWCSIFHSLFCFPSIVSHEKTSHHISFHFRLVHNYVIACYSSPWQLSLCNAKCKIARALILKPFDILAYNSMSLWSGFKVLFLLKSSQKFYPCLALSAFKGPSIRSAIQPTKRHLIQFICRAIFQTESLCCLCICFPRLLDWVEFKLHLLH